MKLSLVIQAIDRATAPIGRVTRGVTGLGSANDRAAGASSRLSGRLAALSGRVRALATGSGGMAALERASHGVGHAFGTIARRAGGLALGGVGVAAAGLTGLFGFLTAGVITTGMKFEQFRMQLEVIEGSSAKAKSSLGWIQQFAATTPYELEDVVGAFTRLRAFGIDPISGALEAMGNAASGMNTSLGQAVEMLADAQNGELERLKEYGIRGSQQGERISFTYQKAGKDVTRTARKGAEVARVLATIFSERFPNMMKRQSTTFGGMLSNLKDQLTLFQLQVADAGFFANIEAKVAKVLERVNALAKNGELKKWAEEISTRLSWAADEAWKFAVNTNWTAVGKELRDTAQSLWTIVEALTEAVRLADRFHGFMGSLARTKETPFDRFMTTPFADWRLFGGKGVNWSGEQAAPRSPKVAPATRDLRSMFRQPLRRDLVPRAPAVPTLLRPGARAPLAWPAGRPTAARAAQPGKVAVDIRLSGPAAPQASVRRVSAAGPVSAEVQRGRAMGGAA